MEKRALKLLHTCLNTARTTQSDVFFAGLLFILRHDLGYPNAACVPEKKKSPYASLLTLPSLPPTPHTPHAHHSHAAGHVRSGGPGAPRSDQGPG
jgi:hypothetical protein